MGRRFRFGLLVLTAFLVTPGAAQAWFVDRGLGGEFGPNTLIVTAAPGETNKFSIGVSGSNDANGVISVADRNGNPVTYGSGCGPPGVPQAPGTGTTAWCGSYAMLGEGATITLADGDDVLEIIWPLLSTGFPDTHVTGGEGNDTIMGGEGTSTLEGGPGNDILGGENGCCGDALEGGNDVITGGDGNDRITGGDGNDLLSGGEGNDKLRGDVGVVFSAGADFKPDNAGNDTLNGDGGNDTVEGDEGIDLMLGSTGLDTLFADDGIRDTRIDCGPGLNRRERVEFDSSGKKSKRDPKPISCKKTKRKRKKK